eukprot:SM000082S22857  [mRNA]  locus=s82:321363:323627:+ [translate_table: standard]
MLPKAWKRVRARLRQRSGRVIKPVDVPDFDVSDLDHARGEEWFPGDDEAAAGGPGGGRGAFIWLHGLGDEPGGPLTAHLAALLGDACSRDDVRWLAPAAPTQSSGSLSPKPQNYTLACYGGQALPSWYPAAALTSSGWPHRTPQELHKAVEEVHSLIDNEVLSGANPKRILLGGFGQGGALALAAALAYPETLAGVAVLWGWIPLDVTELPKAISAQGRRVPVLWSHGMADQSFSFLALMLAVKVLRSAGVAVEWQSFSGKGHQVSEQEVLHLRKWALKRVQRRSAMMATLGGDKVATPAVAAAPVPAGLQLALETLSVEPSSGPGSPMPSVKLPTV